MKLIQKLSILLLIFSLLAVPLSISAEQAQTEEFDAVAMLTAAGLIEKEDAEQPTESYVSRAELAVLAARMRGIEPMSQAYYEMPVFYDVEKDYYEAGYIHAATLSGLMTPAEPGYFKPTEAVTGQTAVKTLLTVLGYQSTAVKRGDTTSSWMNVAAKAGLTDSLSVSADEPITRGMLYRILANSLDVDVMTEELVTKDKVQMSAVKGRNFLEAYHNIYEADGILEDNGHSTCSSAQSGIGASEWLIGGVRCDAEAVAGLNLLGYRVRAFYRDLAGDKQIFYAAPYRNNLLSIDAEDILSFKSRTYRYLDASDREKTLSTAQATVLYNGASAEGMRFDAIPTMGRVTAVDNDRDGKYEVICIEAYQDYLATGVDTTAEVIYVNDASALRLTDYDSYVLQDAQTGAAARVGSIAKGTVLTVATDLHKNNITIFISSQTASGKISLVEQTTRYTEYTLNETVYRASALYESRVAEGKVSRLGAGSKALLYLNKFGQIADAVQQSDFINAYQYGIVIDAKTGTFGDDVQLQVYTALGIMEVMSVSAHPYVDEKKVSNAAALLKSLYQYGENGAQESALVPQLIRFKTDSLGKLTHIDRFGTQPTADKSLYLVKDSFDAEFGQGYSSSMQTIRYDSYNDGYAVGSMDALFTVPVENNRIIKAGEEFYSCDGISKFANGDKFKFQIYKTDPDIISQEVMLVPVELIGGQVVKSVQEEAGINVFLRSAQTVDGEGNPCTQIYYSDDGSEKTAMLDDELNINALVQPDASTYKLQSGDIFRYNVNTAGKINVIEVAYSYTQDAFMPTKQVNTRPNDWWLPNTIMCLSRFNLENYDGSYLRSSFSDPATADMNDLNAYTVVLLNRLNVGNIMVYDTTHRTVRKGTIADLRSYNSVGADYAKGMLYKRYTDPKKLVLYQ